MKRYTVILAITLALVCAWLALDSNTVSSQDKKYTFTITRADLRKLDDVAAGIEITITCRRENLSTGKVGTANVSGYISKTEFASWPPSLSEFRQYLITWLKVKIANQRRLDRLMDKADEPVLSHETINSLLGREITITQ